MAKPSNREEFSEYCLRKLGQPLVQINVAVEQVEDRIDEALYKFYERNYQATETVYIIHDISAPESILDSNGDYVLDSNGERTYTTNTDTEQGFIQLPNDIVQVENVFRPMYFAGVHTSELQFFMNELYSIMNPASVGGGLSYFYMSQSHLKLLNRFFSPEKQFDFNPITGKVVVAGGLKDSDRRHGGLIIRGQRKIFGELEGDEPEGTVIHNIWSNKWLQDYTTALIDKQWGFNLGKYQSVALLGGVTMNGDAIMARAEAQIEKLEEQLLLEYEFPPNFIVG